MSLKDSIPKLQKALEAAHLDGWLLYDFRGSNPILYHLLGIPRKGAPTRRLALWIPRIGEAKLLLHAIEAGSFPPLPIGRAVYISQEEWLGSLKGMLRGKIAMEVVPMGAMPSLSLVDGGTLEAVRSLGIKVVSSGDLLSHASTLSDAQVGSLRQACRFLHSLLNEFWKIIPEKLGKWTELDAAMWLEERMIESGFVTDWHPHVALNAHAADPHYSPHPRNVATLQQGDLLLVDLGCKKGEQGIYGDLTRMAVIGRKPTKEEAEIFSLLLKSQQAGVAFLNGRLKRGERVEGFEVDQVVREVITQGDYGPYFLHRTGHNITSSVHGTGTHLDAFETKDTRPLLTNTCCSLEPGIYLPSKLGLRLETDLLLHPKEVEVVGGWQLEFVVI